MKKEDRDHLVGMWKHPVGGWEICYKQEGKKHSEYRKDKKEAELRAAYWKTTLENPPEDGEGDEEHPVIYWERILRRVAELALKNPTDRDIAATCRSLASAATAALRTAKYIPAPQRTAAPDSAPIQTDINGLTTEQLADLLK